MKTINISRSNGVVRVDVNVELDNRKSQLYVNIDRVEKRFISILDKVKKFSKFHKLSLSYDEIDYYDNEVDVYDTPYLHYTKGSGKRKPTISYQQHGCIPKEWEENYILFLEDPKTIKPIEVFLSEFNITLSAKQLREARKAVKGESSYYTEI